VDDLQTKNIKCDWYFNNDFANVISWLEISFWCIIAYELMKASGFQVFWCNESNYQIIFAFGWWEDHQTIYNKCFWYLNNDFVTAVKVASWKLVSFVWEHMNYSKRVVSNCHNVVIPVIKLFLLLVEWKNFKQ